MSKTGWVLVVLAASATGCCLVSGVAVWLTAGEEDGTVGGPMVVLAEEAPDPGSVVGTWGTQTLGLQPYDTATGSFGPLHATGRTLRLKGDGTFEYVFVLSRGGELGGTYLAGDYSVEGDVLHLASDTVKTSFGGTPEGDRSYRVAFKQYGDVRFLELVDVDSGLTEELRFTPP